MNLPKEVFPEWVAYRIFLNQPLTGVEGMVRLVYLKRYEEGIMNLYDQLMSLEGVTEVEMLDDCQGTSGIYISGGTDESIGEIISRNTRMWQTRLGDTVVSPHGFPHRFYRSKEAFRAKFKDMFGEEFEG